MRRSAEKLKMALELSPGVSIALSASHRAALEVCVSGTVLLGQTGEAFVGSSYAVVTRHSLTSQQSETKRDLEAESPCTARIFIPISSAFGSKLYSIFTKECI